MAKMGYEKYLGALGLLLAVFAPIVSMLGFSMDWVTWVIVVLGFIVGFTMKADVKAFLAGLVLLSITGIFAVVPQFGTLINAIFKNLSAFAGSVLAIPALRVIFSKFKIKM